MNLEIAHQTLSNLKRAFNDVRASMILLYGTCLGAVREGHLLEHDKDIDIAIRFPEYTPELLWAIKKHVGNPILYKFFGMYNSKPVKLWLIRVGDPVRDPTNAMEPHVDLYPLYRNGQGWWRITGLSIKGDREYFMGNCFPLSFFDTLPRVQCNGEYYNVPNPPREYLRLIYGDGWTVPILKKKDIGVKAQPHLPYGRVPR